MRLSLRTLLAFEDNIFDFEQHHQLERIIPKNDSACMTLTRIRRVVTNPRLGAPGLVGQQEELDPNLVAEYLDHQMPAELLERFETHCLSADKFLAEVASVHQILSCVLGEPARTSRECRLRCYDLYRTPSEPEFQDFSTALSENVVAERFVAQPPPARDLAATEKTVPKKSNRPEVVAIPVTQTTYENDDVYEPSLPETNIEIQEPEFEPKREKTIRKKPKKTKKAATAKKTRKTTKDEEEFRDESQGWFIIGVIVLFLALIALAAIGWQHYLNNGSNETAIASSSATNSATKSNGVEESPKEDKTDKPDISDLVSRFTSGNATPPAKNDPPPKASLNSEDVKSSSDTVQNVPSQAKPSPWHRPPQSTPLAQPTQPISSAKAEPLPQIAAKSPISNSDSSENPISQQNSASQSSTPKKSVWDMPPSPPQKQNSDRKFAAIPETAKTTENVSTEKIETNKTEEIAKKVVEAPKTDTVSQNPHSSQDSQKSEAPVDPFASVSESSTADPFLTAVDATKKETPVTEKIPDSFAATVENSAQNSTPLPQATRLPRTDMTDIMDRSDEKPVNALRSEPEHSSMQSNPPSTERSTVTMTLPGNRDDSASINFGHRPHLAGTPAPAGPPAPTAPPTTTSQLRTLPPVAESRNNILRTSDSEPLTVQHQPERLWASGPATAAPRPLPVVQTSSVGSHPENRPRTASVVIPAGQVQENNTSVSVIGRVPAATDPCVVFSASSASEQWNKERLPFTLREDQYLLTVAPFRLEFELGDDFRIEMVGDSKLCVLPPDEKGIPGIFVDYGRLVIRPNLGRAAKPLRPLRIQTEKAEGVVGIAGNQSVVFVDTFAAVFDNPPTTIETDDPENAKNAKTSPILGLLPGPNEKMLWQSEGRSAPVVITAQTSVLLEKDNSDFGSIHHLPNWLQRTALTPEARQLAEECQKIFDEVGDNCESALHQLTQNPSVAVRSLGLRLWGDLGRFDVPLAFLSRSDIAEEPIRRVLVPYFREVMKRDEESVQRLADAIEIVRNP